MIFFQLIGTAMQSIFSNTCSLWTEWKEKFRNSWYCVKRQKRKLIAGLDDTHICITQIDDKTNKELLYWNLKR